MGRFEDDLNWAENETARITYLPRENIDAGVVENPKTGKEFLAITFKGKIIGHLVYRGDVLDLYIATHKLPMLIPLDWEVMAKDRIVDYSRYNGYYFRLL